MTSTPTPRRTDHADIATTREQWKPGDTARFDYSLAFDPKSEVCAALHHRSGQTVTIVAENDSDDVRSELATLAERAESGELITYEIRFPDGFEHDAFEDELTEVR